MASLDIQFLRRTGYVPPVFLQHEFDEYFLHFVPEIVQPREYQQLVIQVVAFFFSLLGTT